MRFKNLTITLTLTSLSIVALAGLVFLPIKANCALINKGWTYSNNNTAANFMAFEDTEGASWQIYASVDANAVSATISPSDYNPSHFTASGLFTGTGLVTAFRDNWFYSHYHYPHSPSSPWTHTHTVLGDIDTNHPTSPFYNGENTALTLDIQVAETVKHTCYARKVETNVSLTVTLGSGDDIVKAGSEFTVGQKAYVAINESVKTTVYIPTVAQNVGVDAGVSFDSSANTSAHVNIDDFEGLTDSGSVWYNAQ